MNRPIAFLFPGQGTIPESFSPFSARTKRLLKLAEAAGLPLADWMKSGARAALARTENAQPTILIDSLTKEESLRSLGISPDFVAGHSLGEYAALVSARVIGPEAALSVVIERGRLMGRVRGEMAAVLKLSPREVEEICAEAGTVIANYNAPGQLVISGGVDAIEHAMKLAKARGGRAVCLNVSGPFHSPAMRPAQDALSPRIEALTFDPPTVPVVSGVSGRVETSPARLKQLLLTQITACVRWEEVVETLVAAGVKTAIEVGAGDVLTRIGRRITDRIEFLTYEEGCDGRA